VTIGIREGLSVGRRFSLARFRGWGSPNPGYALGAFEMLLDPSNRYYFDSPPCLATGHVSMMRLTCPRDQGRYNKWTRS
jgi:hypothetical protein